MLKIWVIFSSTPYKNGRLPKGDQFLQDVSQDKIRQMIAQTLSGKARDILVACCKRKDGMSLRAISSAMMRPYSTVRGWLVRLLQNGLNGRFDKKSTGRKRILGEHAVGTIRNWLYEDPSEFGFVSASWSRGMVRDVIRSRICAFGCIRTLQRALRRIRCSYTKPRPAPRKSATTEEQE